MAGPSAKQIPYGMDGIHMELASIPPGIRLECGGTVKTSQNEQILNPAGLGEGLHACPEPTKTQLFRVTLRCHGSHTAPSQGFDLFI